jgi:hypothetical protein
MSVFLLIAGLAIGLPILLMAFVSFDRLVLLQRACHGEAWERDGRPQSFFLRSEATERSLRSWLATQRCSLTWLFKAPQWAQDDPDARLPLARFRLFVGIWNLVVMPLFVGSVWTVGAR